MIRTLLNTGVSMALAAALFSNQPSSPASLRPSEAQPAAPLVTIAEPPVSTTFANPVPSTAAVSTAPGLLHVASEQPPPYVEPPPGLFTQPKPAKPAAQPEYKNYSSCAGGNCGGRGGRFFRGRLLGRNR